jgi:carbamate kinase
MRTKKIRAIAKQLAKLAQRADELGLTLGNGAQVGSLIGTIADELETRTRP